MPQGLIATALSLALYLSGVTGPSGPTSSGGATPPVPTLSQPAAPAAPATPSGTQVTSSLGATLTIGQRVGVTGTQVNLRATPDNGAPIVARAARGSGATLESAGNGWAKLRLDSGESGWVPDWLLDSHPRFVPSPGNPPSPASPQLPGEKLVYGYYTVNFPGDMESYNAMVANGHRLSGIIPFLFTLESNGRVTGLHNQAAMAAAKERGLTTLALVHNLSGPWFSGSVAHSAIGNWANRSRAVSSIVSLVKTYGYDGVNIDLEAVPSYDRNALTAFMRDLSQALKPLGKLVTISVPAKTYDDPRNSWSGAYDYAALGQYVDLMMLMTYDEHFANGRPGAIASVRWVDAVASYAASQVSPSKLILGVAGYGYDWPSGGKAKAVSYSDAVALARRYGRTIQWSTAAQSPYFTYYKNGSMHTVWFESADSLAHKLKIVEQRGLRGVALWRLGFEDPRFWSLVGSRWG
ncbi:MAG: glycosyl hydrolase family 18 protein [Bacillota bacterium]|nr:glycosyl hydrolase family 18 protein [Bacillota bacterium]